MKAQVLTGSKKEIAETLVHLEGEIREAIVFVEEASHSLAESKDIFAEMEPFMANAGGEDYSREALYSGVDGVSLHEMALRNLLRSRMKGPTMSHEEVVKALKQRKVNRKRKA